MSTEESQTELEARHFLETYLRTDEELLAFTTGQSNNDDYLIGLTAERLLLLPTRNRQLIGTPLSLSRDDITSLKWSGLFKTLRIRFNRDELVFKCRHSWKQRADDLAYAHAQTTVPPESSDITYRLPQIEALQQLGLLNMARTELKQAVQRDPGLTGDPLFDSLHHRISEQGLALRVGSGFFFITLLTLIALTIILGSVQLNLVGIIILLLVGSNLWQRQLHWRTGGILLGLLNALLFGIDFYNTYGLLGTVPWGAFGLTVVLILTGRSTRSRTRTAIGIYVVGHIGLLLLLAISSWMNG